MTPPRSICESLKIGQSLSGSEFFTTLTPTTGYRADGTVPGFIFCGGYRSGGLQMAIVGFCREMARRGYPGISGDFLDLPTKLGGADGPGNWGKDTARTTLDTYRTYLQGTMGAKSGKIMLFHWSHGAALSTGWALDHLSDVYLIAGVVPVRDVEDLRANNRASTQASIESNYTNNAGWQTARPTHNPVEFGATIDDIPQLDWYSTDDPTCTLTAHDAYVATQAANPNYLARSMGAIGHSIGNLASRDHADTKEFCDWVETQLAIQGAI